MLGRKQIFTDEMEITYENVVAVLRDALITHEDNANHISMLLNYESGYQPLVREKTYRPDIDCKCVDNVANEVTEFWRGFAWGNPITLIQAGEVKDENVEEIARLNKYYSADDFKRKTQAIGRYVEICGTCCEILEMNNQYREGKSPFVSTVLDPRTSFIVYSNYYIDHRPMMGVTYREDKKSGNRYFTCITDSTRYEIFFEKVINGEEKKDNYGHMYRSGEKNPFGIINMVEWIRDEDRTGVFERQIDDMNILNLEESDFANDIDQNTQSLWFGIDIEFPRDENGNVKHPSSNDWLLAYSNENGKPSLNPMSVPYDYSGMLSNIQTKRALILQKCNVPQRSDNSGGSTGIAMDSASGWSSAEMSASKKQPFQESAKMKEVEIALEIIRVHDGVETMKMNVSDVQPNIKRQKTYELATKTNALSVMLKNGIDGECAIKTINLFDDPNEVWLHSKENIEKYQKSLFEGNKTVTDGENTPLQDESDQESNSPSVDGIGTRKK